MLLHCDRCKRKFEGDEWDHTTCGFYDVSAEPWAKFGNPYETVVCDVCIWCDPRYIAVYGDSSCKSCFR